MSHATWRDDGPRVLVSYTIPSGGETGRPDLYLECFRHIVHMGCSCPRKRPFQSHL